MAQQGQKLQKSAESCKVAQLGAVLRRIVQFNAVRCRTPMAVGRASKKVQKRAENWQKSQGGAKKGRKLAEKPRGGRKV